MASSLFRYIILQLLPRHSMDGPFYRYLIYSAMVKEALEMFPSL